MLVELKIKKKKVETSIRIHKILGFEAFTHVW